VAENGQKFPLFLNLTDDDFKKIIHFAVTEKWPFNTEKLFLVIKEQGVTVDASLLQFFFQSEEYFAMERFFAGGPFPLQRKVLLTLIREGNWQIIHQFSESQKLQFELSDKKRRDLLLSYIKLGSKTAALLLLYSDMDFAMKHLDDSSALTVLKLLPEKSEKGILFANGLINSLRNDALKGEAQLYLSGDKEVAQKLNNRPAEGSLKPVFREVPPKAPSQNQHIVQSGESLWSISRKYKVPVEEIVRLNQLKNTTSLREGKILKLP
jgi:hypothetical protein